MIDQGNLRTRKVCLLWKVKRPVSMRSMKKVFTKKLCSSDRSGQPDITLSVIEARILSETPVLSKLTMDQGNLMRETAQVHTQWKSNLFLTNIVKLRHSTRTTSSIVQSTRRTSTSTFQDYHILPWSNNNVPAFENWFTNLRSTTESSILSLQSRIKANDSWSWEHRICELLGTKPEAQCKVCLSYLDVGIVYCTCGHFLRDGTEENRNSSNTQDGSPLDS